MRVVLKSFLLLALFAASAHAQVAAGPPPPPPPPGVPGAPPDALDFSIAKNPTMLGVETGIHLLNGSMSGTVFELMAHLGTAGPAVSLGVMSGDVNIDDSGSLTGYMRKNSGYKFAIGFDLFRGPALPQLITADFQGFLLYPCLELRAAFNADSAIMMGTLGVTGARLALPSGMRVDVRVPTATAWFIPLEEPDNSLSANFGYSFGAQLEIGTTSW